MMKIIGSFLMKQLLNFKNKFYFVPGVIVSVLSQLSPSFYVRTRLINLLGKGCNIHPSVTLHNRLRILIPRDIHIDSGSTINSCCLLDSRHPIRIGRRVMLGYGVTIFTLGHDIDDDKFSAKGGTVIVGDNVIVFSKVMIMPGVTIGKGAVVLPGSVVTKDVAPMSVVGGIPAKFIRMRQTIAESDFNYRSCFAL